MAKGGTGGNTAALGRAGLGLKSAAVADILGIVSQSGGIPTGAIIEFGSNANGDYYKFAGGLMICLGRINISGTSWSPSSTVGRYYSQPVGGAFAAAFAAVPRLFPSARDGAIGARSAWCSFISANATGVVEVYMSAMFGGSNQVDIPLDFVAVGRWHS
ncbi:hypothetical protein [Pseudomonas auratipiscis]|uniref:hypothetical protein n=1 Tax=Pseudomonas auratipiscis TaxID=3115853 RepID=UPI002E7BA453|nr:hypothetical protein [Pseudomonas sp. 119P]MEE1961027.1 hypothetical protein [Pseudomonas sp. 119P]